MSEILTLDQLNQQLDVWEKTLQNPLWYKEIMPVLEKWSRDFPENEQTELLSGRVNDYFTEKLDKNEIFLGSSGPDFDQWRKPIDTVVIHHTSGKPGVSWQSLSAKGLLRQYAADYYHYDDQYGINTKDQPLWSGHFRGEKQVFYAYYWLVRLNGEAERLLQDEYIGWQAGNKEINFRSVAIVLDGDFADTQPSDQELEGIAKILKDHYPSISPERVIGHLEANPKTVCPGNLFLPVWKHKILKKLG